MTETCISAIESGADLRRNIGVTEIGLIINTPKSVHAAPEPISGSGVQGIRSEIHRAKELLIRIQCDILGLSAAPRQIIINTHSRTPTGSETGRERKDRTDRSRCMSAPLPEITIVNRSPLMSPFTKNPFWERGTNVFLVVCTTQTRPVIDLVLQAMYHLLGPTGHPK